MKCTVVYGVLAARVIDMDSIDMRSATLDGYDRQCGSDGAMKKGSEMKQPSNKNFGHQRRTGCEYRTDIKIKMEIESIVVVRSRAFIK